MFLYISITFIKVPRFPFLFVCFQCLLHFASMKYSRNIFMCIWNPEHFNIYGRGGGIWRDREMIASFNSPSSWNPLCRKIFESESPRYLWVLGVYTETVWYNHSMTFSGREFNRRATSRYGIQFIHTWLGKMSRNWYDIIIYACNSI